MHTLFDFTSYVKGIEYALALLSIAGYIVFWEILKPKPFKTLVETGRDDLDHIKREGYSGNMKTLKNILAAPFVGGFYLAMVPVAFATAVTFKVFGESASFGWRPVEAYLAGRSMKKKAKAKGDSKQ
jgi:hypothetical protein